jgi:para-aminobenzoate synthetase/4-amino-4-deoxychorismate lyase
VPPSLFPPGTILLDAARAEPHQAGPPDSLLFTSPRAEVVASAPGEVSPALDRVAAAVGDGHWVAGYLTYEAGHALQPGAPLAPHGPGGPLLWFGVYGAPERLAPGEVERRLALESPAALREPVFGMGRGEYRARIARIKHLIREGDVYQINFTVPVRLEGEGSPAGLYARLRARQPVPFGALLRPDDQRWVLSLSPELFFRLEEGRLSARPMKGTTPRGQTPEQDDALAQALAADPKNRAENLMIVDLLRNDLSAVARPGSVAVPALFETERHPTVTQMTSTVTARLAEGRTVADVLRTLFPCGSITGAPKRRAMQRIAELESAPRGVYCGAIGYVAPGADGPAATFNVPIRTLELAADGDGWRGRMGVGSGVVWDSDADAEYDECLLKARFLTGRTPIERAGTAERDRIRQAGDLSLLETMRAEGGAVARLDLHLDRLARAAAFFEIDVDLVALREQIQAAIPERSMRLRLTVDRSGSAEVKATPLENQQPIRTAAVFPEPAAPDDPFLRFKTTHRPFYRRALDWAEDHGIDEPILKTADGRLVEGARSNVWIERASRLLTPVLHGAGLGGVERAHLLATDSRCEAAALTETDLWTAESVYLSNAVRGLFRVDVRRL